MSVSMVKSTPWLTCLEVRHIKKELSEERTRRPFQCRRHVIIVAGIPDAIRIRITRVMIN